MYIHTLACFCESQGCFLSPLSLKYITYSFFSVCSLCSLPAAVSPLRSPPPPLPRREAIRAPLSSSLPSFRLSSAPAVCCVFRGCRVSPVVSPWLVPSCLLCVRAPEDPWRPSVCRSVCRAACLLLVHRQAQDAVAMWTDAPRICPRPFVLFMCCRALFRGLCRGFLPSVRVCVLLPCVVRWQ